MTDNEEYVRSKWDREWVGVHHHSNYHDDDFYSVQIRCFADAVVNPHFLFSSEIEQDKPDCPLGWSAAAEFTRARERKITEVEEEISLQEWSIAACEGTTLEAGYTRTLKRLQLALAELKRGMKP